MPSDLELAKAAAEGTAAGLTQSLHVAVLNLFGGATEELGAELRATVRRWRDRRELELAQKVGARLVGRPRRPIPPKVLLPALEFGSLEDHEELRSMWVDLLATAGTDGAVEVERRYVEILRDLTPLDAQALQWIRGIPDDESRVLTSYELPLQPGQTVYPRVSKQAAMEALQISGAQFDLLASRLASLGLCDAGRFNVPAVASVSSTGPRIYDRIILTPLGVAFVEACSRARGRP